VVQNCKDWEEVVNWMAGELKNWLMGVVVAGNWLSKEELLHKELMDMVTMEVVKGEEERQGKGKLEEDNLGGKV